MLDFCIIKIRTFLKKNNPYVEKYKFACHFKELKLKQIAWNLEQQ